MRTPIMTCLLWLAATAWAGKPDPDVAAFLVAKRHQAEEAADRFGTHLPTEISKMFAAAAAGDWLRTSNLFESIAIKYKPFGGSSSNHLAPGVWYPVQEAGGLCGLFAMSEPKFIRLFGEEIFKVVPDGSVYFGGTDPGRFIITGLSRSDQEGKPFITLTQNQLADTNYLGYLCQMHGTNLNLPDAAAMLKAFEEYSADVARRSQHDQDFPQEPKQVKPGENIRIANGRQEVSGEIAVMAINGLLAKDIFDSNPKREFWVEESYPIDWMYPCLVPVGPIFRINRQQLERLPDDTILANRRYWDQLTQRLLGLDVRDVSSVEEVCAMAKRLDGAKAPADFVGDPAFLKDKEARKAFGKLRSAHASVYAWRVDHALSAREKRRMASEADFAFKQGFVLCPFLPETNTRYVNFLVGQDQLRDAETFARSAVELNPGDTYSRQLAEYVQQVIDWKRRRSKMPQIRPFRPPYGQTCAHLFPMEH